MAERSSVRLFYRDNVFYANFLTTALNFTEPTRIYVAFCSSVNYVHAIAYDALFAASFSPSDWAKI